MSAELQEVEKVETPETEPSLREEIQNSIKEVEEKQPEGRDEKGRFVQKEEKEEKAEVIETPEAVKLFPKHGPWAKFKDKYDSAPAELQKLIYDREEEIHAGFTKFDEERNFGKTMKEVVTPYIPIIKAEGGTPEGAVKDLLNTAYILRTAQPAQKLELIKQICTQYGIDPTQIGQVTQAVDPYIQNLESKISQLEQKVTSHSTLQDQQENARIQTELQAFLADPKNIYFEQVKDTMSTLLASGVAKDFKDAYDRACWTDPEIRSALMTAQKADEEAKRKSDNQSKKNASVSVTGNPGLVAPNAGNPNRTLREEIAANYRQYNS